MDEIGGRSRPLAHMRTGTLAHATTMTWTINRVGGRPVPKVGGYGVYSKQPRS